ncbi:MAG: hypothetical protein WCT03_01795 [Candidatus Obscuribacterales bacterium]
MGKQRTSRPQAFKATNAATSEMKAHVGEKNSGKAGAGLGSVSETHFADGELAGLLDSLSEGAVVRTSMLITINGKPSLKLSNC